MIKRFWYTLFPKWEDYKVYRGVWNNVEHDQQGDGIEFKRHCRATIQYSERLNNYRIQTVGYMPKEHKCYQLAVDYMTLLKKKRDEDQNR